MKWVILVRLLEQSLNNGFIEQFRLDEWRSGIEIEGLRREARAQLVRTSAGVRVAELFDVADSVVLVEFWDIIINNPRVFYWFTLNKLFSGSEAESQLGLWFGLVNVDQRFRRWSLWWWNGRASVTCAKSVSTSGEGFELWLWLEFLCF